ncbi:hypothetical protein USDA257_c34940 [Sinorhizobium fredii USDA 257]|uniref:Uncharacterized protein n=1 Tax=Sinorhizobium fredii (strain USDA 257) TaxID=1185652 RepID=I3X847_SINF2|nr:hypothetical protein USDA257_c34940 [Sinorhizobium fredii USDA 257]
MHVAKTVERFWGVSTCMERRMGGALARSKGILAGAWKSLGKPKNNG